MEVTIDLSVIGPWFATTGTSAGTPPHRYGQQVAATDPDDKSNSSCISLEDHHERCQYQRCCWQTLSPIHASTHCADIIRIIFQMTKNQIKMIRSETLNYTPDIKRMPMPTEKLFNENNKSKEG
jgi:hypothetical protein